MGNCTLCKIVLHAAYGDLPSGRLTLDGIRLVLVSLGCLGFVKRGDKTMFSADALGLVDASVRTVSEQLYFAVRDVKLVREQHLVRLIGLMAAPQDVHENSLAAIALCRCPDDFDPIARYVGGGALYWHPVDAWFNDVNALDPWSRELLELDVLRTLLS